MIEPLIPPGKPGGGTIVAIREQDHRSAIGNGSSTGCQYPARAAQGDFSAQKHRHDYLGPVELGRHAASRIHHGSTSRPRESRARSQPHGPASSDSQSVALTVPAASSPGLRCRQADQGKKRHVRSYAPACSCRASSPPPIVQDRDDGLRCWRPWGSVSRFSGNCSRQRYQGPDFHRALAGILPDLENGVDVVRAIRSGGEGLRLDPAFGEY